MDIYSRSFLPQLCRLPSISYPDFYGRDAIAFQPFTPITPNEKFVYFAFFDFIDPGKHILAARLWIRGAPKNCSADQTSRISNFYGDVRLS